MVWGNAYVSIMRDKNKNPLYMIGMVEDITERKKIEQKKKEYTKELEAQVEARTKELKEKLL